MRLNMTFFLVMSSAVHSQLDTPEKQNAHQPLCTRPKETPLKELVEAKVDDKYPITDVDNAIRKLDRNTRDTLQTARRYTNSLCYRYNPFQPRFNESLAGRPFEFFPIATDSEIEPRPTWSPTCSSSSKSFYFPRTVTHDGQTCWMVFPWYQMRCPYVICTNKACGGVKGKVSRNSPGVTACRGSTLRSFVYYIWCPRSGIVRRYVRLPQSCSCMSLYCLGF